MKKIGKGYALIVFIACFVYIMCLVGCVTKTNKNVYEIAPHESMQVTSYGGFCDYPLKNGGYIRVDFYGKDLIVGAVKEVS